MTLPPMESGNPAWLRGLLMLLLVAVTASGQDARVLETEGRVIVTKNGQPPAPAKAHTGLAIRDRLGTGASSRAVLQMSPRWLARVDEETDVEITPGVVGATGKDALSVALGGIFVFSRESEGELKIVTPSATGGLRGTQLVARVFSDGRTLMQVIEGEVDLTNDLGSVSLRAGETGEAERGKAPRKTAVIDTQNLLQWALYYPAVLAPNEFGFTADEQRDLLPSLDAYRQGDLLGALDQYPANTAARTPSVELYHAAVLLATGRVDASRAALQKIPADQPGRRALERMIAAVLFREQPAWPEVATASEAMAESYYQQSRSRLPEALAAARRATELAPDSGFAWTRRAELEFSFGRTRESLAAIERGLQLTPRNAQAHALRGYLLSAGNNMSAARASFETALQLDGGLGNAWLGLGLTKIKQGRVAEGRADLQTAATVEPTRAFLYSYHGKALALANAPELARKDFALARQIDPKDPTPWLYSAILSQQGNRYNEAIDSMGESVQRNNNRQVYRSRFLLDQDRSVRSTNLAAIYRKNGMTDVSVREATRAVEADYTNASSHLFLANSLDALRDPNRLLLRYETAWFNEKLLADMFAPVGGGPLSQFVSQQEYSKLFEADGVGGNVIAEAREHGYIDVVASGYANYGRFGTGIDYVYHRDDTGGADVLRQELFWQMKYQPTADDILYTLVKWQEEEGGDIYGSNNPGFARPGLRYSDSQKPGLALAGWNHRWAPGLHTLILLGRQTGDYTWSQPNGDFAWIWRVSDSLVPGFLLPTPIGTYQYTSPELRNATVPPVSRNPDGSLQLSADFQRLIAPYLGQGPYVTSDPINLNNSSEWKFTIDSAELQQVWQTGRHTLVAGARAQSGEFEGHTLLTIADPADVPFFLSPPASQHVSVPYSRGSFYLYEFFRATPTLTLIGGMSYDKVEHPANVFQPPMSDEQMEESRPNTKLGFSYVPNRWLTVRGAYLESLGGATFDESVRLEPAQIAGFTQAFRSVISEAIVDTVQAPVYHTLGGSIEGSTPTRTWWGMSYNRIDEEVDRTVGNFDFFFWSIEPFVSIPTNTPQHLDYREEVFTATVDQLLGEQFAVGAAYRRTNAELRQTLPLVPAPLTAFSDRHDEATLDEVSTHAVWNTPSGWFAGTQVVWRQQDVTITSPGFPQPGSHEDFVQVDVWAGWRFRQNRCELTAGVLNLTDQDYQLNPLTYTRYLPHERTFFARCRVGF